MNTDSVTFERSISIGKKARKMGLKTDLLYESVIEIAEEGMLTAHSVNAAAQILLGELGLPEYCFRNIDADTLKSVLRVLATNIRPGPNGRYLLNSQEAPLLSSVVDGIQILLASDDARERTDQAAGSAVEQKHWEYYHCHRNHYHTYVIKPGSCPSLEEVAAGASPFSMVQSNHGFHVPAETRLRYDAFLKQHKASVGRRIQISPCEATMETRIMFHKNIDGYWLSIMRRRFEELGLRITRAYGEPYRTDTGTIASVCSIYVLGELDEDQCEAIGKDLRAMLALPPHTFAHLYLESALTFEQMLFAVNASCFIHQFIYIEQETDRKLMESLKSEQLRAALARRISRANRNEHTRHVITETLRENPDLLHTLFELFDARFNPERAAVYDAHEQGQRIELFDRSLQIRFSDDSTALDIFRFACRLITDTLKTNFYKLDRRSYSFRLDSAILDPIVFPEPVFGIFFVLGHYSLGTHMRAEDIARGGLRLLRVTAANYDNQLDDANLLNYALGPRAQRLKHKDIAESGAKGVIVPTPNHAYDGLNAVYDYSEGILDLILPSSEIVDHYGKPEMIFFGPDEGTAGFMDRVAERARERGYPYWRTFTTGKSIGIPHDAYGLTTEGTVFGLLEGNEGTELTVEGAEPKILTDMAELSTLIPGDIVTNGMTTTGVMATFRVLVKAKNAREEDLPLMMTGGPDGDLGANQIQCYCGAICLIIDGGGILFDPDGLDKEELRRLAFDRHSSQKRTSIDYDIAKLGPEGFFVKRESAPATLPDGTQIDDAAFFHKTFLFTPANRRFVERAGIRAFIPCGGFKDTIHTGNVRDFLSIFQELEYIVEGANVFFDRTARDVIASETDILQIKDTTANKGGVTSSSLAEVLSAFLLGDDYERHLVDDLPTKFRLVRELLDIITRNAEAETQILLALHKTSNRPLWRLSVDTSEQLLAFQQRIAAHPALAELDKTSRLAILQQYTPPVLLDLVGVDRAYEILNSPELAAYGQAILTKKLAANALYQHAADWEAFLARFEAEPAKILVDLATA